VLEGELEATTFEENLRCVCVQQGWKLYTIEKSCMSILKFIQSIVPSDSKEKNLEKEKTADIVLRFQKDRQRTEFTRERGEYQELVAYRRAVESILGNGEDLYRIDWHENTSTATIRIVPRDALTVTSELTKDEKWNYYIQTYMMCAPTEGIPLGQPRKVFLQRCYPTEKDLRPANPNNVVSENTLVRICVNTYRLFFSPGTEDVVVKDPSAWGRIPAGAKEKRQKLWREKVLPSLGWMKNATEQDKIAREEEWKSFLAGHPPVATARKRSEPPESGVGASEGGSREKRVRSAEVTMGGM